MPNCGSPLSITFWSQSMNQSALNSALSAHGMSRSDMPIRKLGSTPAKLANTLLQPRYRDWRSFQNTAFAIESMRICSIC